MEDKELIYELDRIRKQKKITHQKISDKTGINRELITKFFDANKRRDPNPTLKMYSAIARALDYQLKNEEIDNRNNDPLIIDID